MNLWFSLVVEGSYLFLLEIRRGAWGSLGGSSGVRRAPQEVKRRWIPWRIWAPWLRRRGVVLLFILHLCIFFLDLDRIDLDDKFF